MHGKLSCYCMSSKQRDTVEEICRLLKEKLDIGQEIENHIFTLLGIFRLDTKNLIEEVKGYQSNPIIDVKGFLDGQPTLEELRKFVLGCDLAKLLGVEPGGKVQSIVDELFAHCSFLAEEEQKSECSSHNQPVSEPTTRSEPVSRAEQEKSYLSAFPALPKGTKLLPGPVSTVWHQRCPLSANLCLESKGKIQQTETKSPTKRPICGGKENERSVRVAYKNSLRNRSLAIRRKEGTSSNSTNLDYCQFSEEATNIVKYLIGLDNPPTEKESSAEETSASAKNLDEVTILGIVKGEEQAVWGWEYTDNSWWERSVDHWPQNSVSRLWKQSAGWHALGQPSQLTEGFPIKEVPYICQPSSDDRSSPVDWLVLFQDLVSFSNASDSTDPPAPHVEDPPSPDGARPLAELDWCAADCTAPLVDLDWPAANDIAPLLDLDWPAADILNTASDSTIPFLSIGDPLFEIWNQNPLTRWELKWSATQPHEPIQLDDDSDEVSQPPFQNHVAHLFGMMQFDDDSDVYQPPSQTNAGQPDKSVPSDWVFETPSQNHVAQLFGIVQLDDYSEVYQPPSQTNVGQPNESAPCDVDSDQVYEPPSPNHVAHLFVMVPLDDYSEVYQPHTQTSVGQLNESVLCDVDSDQVYEPPSPNHVAQLFGMMQLDDDFDVCQPPSQSHAEQPDESLQSVDADQFYQPPFQNHVANSQHIPCSVGFPTWNAHGKRIIERAVDQIIGSEYIEDDPPCCCEHRHICCLSQCCCCWCRCAYCLPRDVESPLYLRHVHDYNQDVVLDDEHWLIGVVSQIVGSQEYQFSGYRDPLVDLPVVEHNQPVGTDELDEYDLLGLRLLPLRLFILSRPFRAQGSQLTQAGHDTVNEACHCPSTSCQQLENSHATSNTVDGRGAVSETCNCPGACNCKRMSRQQSENSHAIGQQVPGASSRVHGLVGIFHPETSAFSVVKRTSPPEQAEQNSSLPTHTAQMQPPLGLQAAVTFPQNASLEQKAKMNASKLEVIKSPQTDSFKDDRSTEENQELQSTVDKSILSMGDIFRQWLAPSDQLPDFLMKEHKATQTLVDEAGVWLLHTTLPMPTSQPQRSTPPYEEKHWKDLMPLSAEDYQRDFMYQVIKARENGHQLPLDLDVSALEGYSQEFADFSQVGEASASLHVPERQAVYVKDLENAWLSESYRRLGKSRVRRPLHPNKPCTFYLEGCCYRFDCKYSHDLSSITCHFWELGQCFKGDLCPFLHGYFRGGGSDGDEVELTSEDFPELSRKEVRLNSAPAPKKRRHKKNSVHRLQLPRGT